MSALPQIDPGRAGLVPTRSRRQAPNTGDPEVRLPAPVDLPAELDASTGVRDPAGCSLAELIVWRAAIRAWCSTAGVDVARVQLAGQWPR